MSHKKNYHPFHIVDPSPWPFITSIMVFSLVISMIQWMHFNKFFYICLSIILLSIAISHWLRDIIREGTYLGFHTKKVQKSLTYGFILFIWSEVMLFFSFFWSYGWFSISPAIEIGYKWPPLGVLPINPWNIPLANTALLLFSACLITVSHYSLQGNLRNRSLKYLLYTIICGILFTLLQYYEFKISPFTIADSVYGSIFFLITGFHGAHVIIGTIFLLSQYWRIWDWQVTKEHHCGFTFSIWYWHFVDVIWIFVYFIIYFWGGNFLI